MVRNTTYVVGFSGLAQSGKDTTVQNLIDMQFIYPTAKIRRFSFADELKKMYAYFLYAKHRGDDEYLRSIINNSGYTSGLSDSEKRSVNQFFVDNTAMPPFERTNEEHKKQHRRQLIDLGMLMRTIKADYWVNIVKEEIDRSLVDFACISDVRFENELCVCDSLVRIHRDSIEPIYIDGKIPESEVLALDNDIYDYYIDNSGSLLALKEETTKLYWHMLRSHPEFANRMHN